MLGKSFRTTALILIAAIVLAACGSAYGSSPTPAPAVLSASPTPAPAASPTGAMAESTAASPVVIMVAQNATLGAILTDLQGRTLYMRTSDTKSTPGCYDTCAQNWPPLVGAATAGSGANGSLLGTASRTDGSTQVTYNGWPLYYFKGDTAAGDTKGEGLAAVWFAVSPSGNKVAAPSSQSGGSAY